MAKVRPPSLQMKIKQLDIRKVIILMILLVLSLVQIVERFQYYLTEPILSEITVLKEADFTLPATTICNSIKWDAHDEKDLASHVKKPEKFWASNVTLPTIVAAKVPGINGSNECEIHGLFKQTMVTTGQCWTLSLANQSLSHQTRSARTVEFEFYFRQKVFVHDDNLNPLYDFNVFGRHLRSINTVMSISFKKVEYYNATTNPCVSEEDYNNCKLKCYDEEFRNILGCSLPFVSPKDGIESCPIDKAVLIDLLSFIQDVTYKTDADCFCRRSCSSTLYMVSYESMPSDSKMLPKLTIQFRTRFMIGIREYLGYPFESLISDIGGILSLFMGFSLLTLIEGIETKIIQFYKRRQNTILRMQVVPK